MTHQLRSDAPSRISLKLARIESEIAAQGVIIALLRLKQLILKYDSDQPRVPAGNPNGGQWTSGGGTGAGASTSGGTNTNVKPEKWIKDPEIRERYRKQFVVQGHGTIFNLAPNPNANAKAPSHENPDNSQVEKYDSLIRRVAKEENVDPDLIRTMMYMETTHGKYGGLGPLADQLGVSRSVLPMNVRVSVWGDVFGSRLELNDPLNNIRAGAKIIRGIAGNLKPEQRDNVAIIASLYNYLPATIISDYGARAQNVYRYRLWKYGGR